MSNYKFGLAVANSITTDTGAPGQISTPTDPEWWEGFIPYMTERYDTPKIERDSVQKKLLPMFLYWEGEHIFHYSHSERIIKRDRFFREVLPAEHPFHNILSYDDFRALEVKNKEIEEQVMMLIYQLYEVDDEKEKQKLQLEIDELQKITKDFRKIDKNRKDPFLAYGGDYWLHEVYKNVAFWEGLHKAGTRGLFILEVGSEHSLSFDDFSYALYDQASCPAWFLIVADLRGDIWKLEKVYPRVSDIKEIKPDTYYGQDLHFYAKYEGKMIEEALSNPHRELLTADILHIPSEPWYVF